MCIRDSAFTVTVCVIIGQDSPASRRKFFCFCHNFPSLFLRKKITPVQVPEVCGNIFLVGMLTGLLGPVSYTHLDVYKRQNPESALACMEIGQEVSVKFGYELDDGSVEWLPPQNSYLKSWSADEQKAKFTATDVFDYLDGTYRRGRYMPQGISLYDCLLYTSRCV